MLGVSALQAFADEASAVAAAANKSLGKNLVYDDVYGVTQNGFALMVKRGLIQSGSDAYVRATQIALVDSSGTELASFGMDDAPSSTAEIDKADCVSSALDRMELFMRDGFTFYGVPKNVNDKIKYGFTSKDGAEIAPFRYDALTATAVSELAAAALDFDGSVVDIYDAGGVKTTSIPMPADWSEGWADEPYANLLFTTGKKDSLALYLSGNTSDDGYASKKYCWDSASNSFVAKGDVPYVEDTERTWDVPGGAVTIAKAEGQGVYTCTTPQGSFAVDAEHLWQFKVFAEEGLIQCASNGIARIWDLSGTETTVFEGAVLDAYLGDGRFLCCKNSMEGQQYSIRQADGTTVKVLPGIGAYRFDAPFVCVTDSDGAYVLLDSSGNEVKKIVPSSNGKTISLRTSAVEEVLVVTEEEPMSGDPSAVAAYDKTSGEWIDAKKATAYARASETTLHDKTVAYRIPVYDPDDGTIYPRATPAYYRYVDRNLNVLSYGDYSAQAAYTGWINTQQTQRTLGDGTTMFYTVNESGKYGAVDGEGAVLIPFEYDAYYDCGDDDSLILLKKDGAWEFFDTSTVNTSKEPVPATSVTISGAPEQLPVGKTAQLTAAVEPADSTDKVAWASSDESVLTVDAAGLVTAVANGEATVTAMAGEHSDSATITVTTPATSVTVSGASENPLNVGDTVQLRAEVKPEGTTDKAMWASSNANVLTVDADGLVTALANGEATVTATAGEHSDSATITVVTPATGVELDAAALTLYVGDEPSKLEVTVLPATASNKNVAWKSSNSNVATVDDNGAVTPVGVGTCTVTATTLDGGLTAACTVTVGEHVAGVALDKSEASIVGAGTTQLMATVSPAGALDKSVAWSTSDESVATVDDNGLVTSVGKGKAVITATSLEDEQQSASCTVTVSNPVTGLELSAASVALTKGNGQVVNVAAYGALPGAVDDYDVTLSVEGDGSFSNGVWSDASGNAVFSVAADVDGGYAIDALGTGKGTLVFEAKQGSSTVKGAVAVSVTNPAKAITLDMASKQVVVGDESFTLKATVNPTDADEAGSIVWSTSNAAVASVKDGVVAPVSAGSAVITAKAGTVSATCTVTVTAKQIAATEGDSAFQASVEASDSAVADQLDKIAQENGGLALAVQGAEDLTDKAQQAIASLQSAQAKVAEVLDVSFRNVEGGEVPVNLDGGMMTVRVQMTDAMRALDPATLVVSHVADDGAIKAKSTWVDGDDLCFATEHFSTYVVTGNERQTTGGGSGGGSNGGSGTVLPGGGSGQNDAVKSLLAPTGDTAALPLALAGCAIAAALVCLAYARGGRRVK